jgi:hypothetical protein
MKLLGITDLAKRWKYTIQGVRKKIKCDENFPKPIAVINKNALVFLEDDIIPYEQKRKELIDSDYKRLYRQKSRYLNDSGESNLPN